MKFADAKKELARQQSANTIRSTPPGTFCFVPTQKEEVNQYNSESITLALGHCPMCTDGSEVTTEIARGKVWYQCKGNQYHFFVRDAME